MKFLVLPFIVSLSFGYNGHKGLTLAFNRFAPPKVYVGSAPIQEAIKYQLNEF